MINVHDINIQRFEAALDLFEKGGLLRFNEARFLLSAEGDLEVQVESTWEIGNVTDETGRSDLKRAELTLEYLSTNSPRFNDLIGERPRRIF